MIIINDSDNNKNSNNDNNDNNKKKNNNNNDDDHDYDDNAVHPTTTMDLSFDLWFYFNEPSLSEDDKTTLNSEFELRICWGMLLRLLFNYFCKSILIYIFSLLKPKILNILFLLHN